jgi:hypothetical protein
MPALIRLKNVVYRYLTRPCRILKTLYSLGIFLDQNSTPPHGPRRNTPAERITRHDGPTVTTIVDADDADSHSSLSENEPAPVTASQVYHAALLNGHTLDDLLSDLEASETNVPDAHDIASPSGHEQHNRSSSILNTPQECIDVGGECKALPSSEAFGTSLPEKESKDQRNSSLETVKPPLGGPGAPVPYQHTCTTSNADTNAGPMRVEVDPCNGKEPHIDGKCPTFTRHQARSNAPGKSVANGRAARRPVNAAAARNGAVIDSGSPVRRNRLQRRGKD